ncbi:MAG: hypothetical protein A2Y03_04715 [Omnitrophica WOR_2 bacterium GWF2_38_59]|nr:MAG: hypothetical protein A2Y03_04715 [Omnitrophica WOR_2 bacterium GWF2_38_59]OGX50745.1 MAG: hypothetical protein A2243_03785 [Omnitrophica WOR_2 bacterium RIFOXYA2_FULL_38_17]OGX51524.1 MAG: hypothetical protein A2267_00035 [Omnitrophica WOR_2 bacterium RIFOXYA12_FULL_38_10]HBG62251.1 hypothetical protein [Candidatus Omnitrophota bacterium]
MNELFSAVFKFILTLVLIPVIYAATILFGKHYAQFSGVQEDFFYWGIWFFVVVYIFVYQFKGVQDAGRKIVSGIFGFVSFGKNFFANIFPFYFFIIMLGFHVARNVFNVKNYNHFFLFFGGFSIAMHVIETAGELQSQEKGLVKPNYYFSICLVYLFSVFFIILMMNLLTSIFTFPKYINGIIKISNDIFIMFWKGFI